MGDNLKVKGKFTGMLLSPDGQEKQRVEIDNLVVDKGLEMIADQLRSEPLIDIPSHVGLGEGDTEPSGEDEGLQIEVGDRQSVSRNKEPGEPTIEYFASFGPDEPIDDTVEITEAGLFNASSGGDLLARVTFGVVTKEPQDTYELTWEITITAG